MITKINCKFDDDFSGMELTNEQTETAIDQIGDKLLAQLTAEYPRAEISVEFEHRLESRVEVESDIPAEDLPWNTERDILDMAGEISEQVISGMA
jgi:hypothetical protein